MTKEDRAMLERINKYAEEVMPDIDPQKTQISVQLEKLRPVMQQIAMETMTPIEDIFIKYMDLATEAGIEREAKFQENMGNQSFSNMANRLE